MTCPLTWLSVCLLDVLDPSNIYASAALITPITKGQMESAVCDGRWCSGPLADLRIGMRVELTRQLAFDLGLRHTSFVQEDDRGEESAFVSVTWRPWR